MEIQDKNNILQQMLGARMFNVSDARQSDNVFADMLETGKAKGATSFDEAKKSVAVSVKDRRSDIKAEPVAKENKKEKVQPKKSESVSDKPKEKADNKVSADTSEDKAVAAVSAPVDNQDSHNAVQNDGEMSAEGVAVVGQEAGGDVSIAEPIVVNLQPEVQVLMPSDTMQVSGTDIPEEVLSQLATDDVVSVLDVDENVVPVAADASAEQVALEGDEALLLRQAEYIDKKVNPEGKMKIEVAVQEEKIAAPAGDSVVQNRFEVDALLRKLDGNEDFVLSENGAEQIKVAEVAGNKAMATNIQADTLDNVQVGVAGFQTAEDSAQVSVEASRLSASGKEILVEASSTMRSETFARINETSSRDNFRGMGKEVVEQIKVNITKSAVKGVDTIDIQLKPEDLGKIQVKMHISRDGRVQAEIISGRQETLDMLQKEISGLAKAFEDAGYETDGKSFSFSFQDDNQAGKQSDDDSGLLKFIGDALEQEAESTAGNDNVIYNPAQGLNIRV